MKKHILKKMLVNVTTLAMITILFQTLPQTVSAEEPLDELPGWIVDGTGTYFEITNSSYLNVTLRSSESVHIHLESVPKMISYYIERNCSADSTFITLSNLQANKVYYIYQDGNLVKQIITDENGTYSHTSDLTANHLFFIQEETSTIYIKNDGTISPPTAPISRVGSTYTVTSNIYEPIKIQKPSITLDGAGYLVQGSGSGNGIEIISQNYVTIKNIRVKGFSYGIYVYFSSYNTIKESDISNNIYGIYMYFQNYDTIKNNTLSTNQYGMYLFSAYYNIITNNTFASNSISGIYFQSGYTSWKNIVSQNIFSYNSNGLYFIGDDNWYATITNNTFSYNSRAIVNIDDHCTLLHFNTFSSNTIGIYLRNSVGDRFHHNNMMNNINQFYQYDSSSWAYWDDGYGKGNYWSDYTGIDDGSNGRTAGDGVGDTLIPHPYINKGNRYYRLDNYPLMRPWGLNDPPVANANGPYTGVEGSTITFDASASTDPNGDPLQYRWDFNNDGNWDTSYSTDPTASHTWVDNYNGIITVEVYDGQETDIATSTVTINNVAPTVEAGLDQNVNEGTQVTIGPTFSDPGTSDTHIATIDWQDGNPTSIDPAISPLSVSHTYNDDGMYTITVTITDDDLDIGTDTLTVTVNDLGPTAIAGVDQIIDECHTINVDGSGSFSSPDTIVVYEWDWTSDGIYDTTGATATSPPYVDNGVYTITLRVTDDDGTMNTDILLVTVNDLTPVAGFTWSPEPQNEGTQVQFTDTSTSYPDDIVSWSWDFDGLGMSTDQNPVFVFQDNDLFTVTLTITDDDGSMHSVSHLVTILNVAPVVDVGIDQTVNEGDLVCFSGDFFDPGAADTHIFDWDFGDGAIISGTLIPTHSYADNGVYKVTLTVTDDDSGVGIDTLTITVNNVAPIVTPPADTNAYEGSSITIDQIILTDPGADTFTATINWGDGNIDNLGSVTNPIPGQTHTYTEDAVYTVTITVSDDDGGITIVTTIVTVENIAPSINLLDILTPINENDVTFLTATVSDPGSDDTNLHYIISWGDGTTTTTGSTSDGTINENHQYLDDDNDDTYTISLTVTDTDNSEDVKTIDITVHNLPPMIQSINLPLAPVQIGTPVQLITTFIDIGTTDTHTAIINWDDGTETTGNINSYTLTDTHTYNKAGVYTITITITDDDTGFNTQTYHYVVIYDPGGGFVTGGGWINSPAGAYTPNPALTGKANFGFVSKYIKGQIIPSGNTEFNFKVANMNFHSENYQWLVITNAKAMYKGTGTINGQGNYGFIISAIDEALTPSADIDLFRIKIWDKNNNDQVIYDNQFGAEDDSDPTTTIGGGNIVIHSM